jgi:hypothetical protein
MPQQARQRLAAGGFRHRYHFQVEMGLVAHGDHRAKHDDPDETEPRHLLGPDVARDPVREARQDLHEDRDEQQSHQQREQQLQPAIEQVDGGLHGAASVI